MGKCKREWCRRAVAAVLAVAVAVQGGSALAGALSDGPMPPGSQDELLQMIQLLKQRVEELEAKTGNLEGMAEESAKVSIRQSDLEAKVGELSTSAAPGQGPMDFRAYWNSGLRLDSGDGNFKLRIGGRIQNDWAWFDDSRKVRPIVGGADLEDQTIFRRARLNLQGDIYGNIEYKAQYDFAGGVSAFKDVYMGLKGIPVVGGLRVGQFKEPFSLDELTSSVNIMFIERALPNVFAPARSTGAMIHNNALDQRLTWALGIFRDTDDFGNGADDGGYSVTGRLTGLPWYADGGRQLVHLGLGYSHRNVDGGWRYRQRPEVGGTFRYVDTGTMAAEDVDLFNVEAALVYGPFSAQGEWILAEVDTERGPGLFDRSRTRDFDGAYLQASYFLTGENRAYSRSSAAFDRVKPNQNFKLGDEWGPGAWELALRWSTLDLDDGNRWTGVRGGSQDNYTVGVNWYLNPNTKVMFNYVNADVDRAFYGGNRWFPLTRGGDIDILQTRFQVDF